MTDFDLYATLAVVAAGALALWCAGRAELREEREDTATPPRGNPAAGWRFPPTEGM